MLLPVYLFLDGVARPPGFAVIEAVYLLFIALMMVSRIPTYAGKTLGTRVPREWVVPMLIAASLAVALLVIHTFEVLTVVTVVYLALIPIGVRAYRRREREQAASAKADAAARAAARGCAGRPSRPALSRAVPPFASRLALARTRAWAGWVAAWATSARPWARLAGLTIWPSIIRVHSDIIATLAAAAPSMAASIFSATMRRASAVASGEEWPAPMNSGRAGGDGDAGGDAGFECGEAQRDGAGGEAVHVTGRCVGAGSRGARGAGRLLEARAVLFTNKSVSIRVRPIRPGPRAIAEL